MKNNPEFIIITCLSVTIASLFTKDIEIIKLAFIMTSSSLTGYFGYLKQP